MLSWKICLCSVDTSCQNACSLQEVRKPVRARAFWGGSWRSPGASPSTSALPWVSTAHDGGGGHGGVRSGTVCRAGQHMVWAASVRWDCRSVWLGPPLVMCPPLRVVGVVGSLSGGLTLVRPHRERPDRGAWGILSFSF